MDTLTSIKVLEYFFIFAILATLAVEFWNFIKESFFVLREKNGMNSTNAIEISFKFFIKTSFKILLLMAIAEVVSLLIGQDFITPAIDLLKEFLEHATQALS